MTNLVLLADDDEDSRDLVSFLLQRGAVSAKLLFAENGKEAVALAQERQPRLILMDMNMPVMDGWTAVSLLKKDDRTKDIPVIAFTARAGQEDVARTKGIGCVAHFAKPIDPEELMKIIQTYIHQ